MAQTYHQQPGSVLVIVPQSRASARPFLGIATALARSKHVNLIAFDTPENRAAGLPLEPIPCMPECDHHDANAPVTRALLNMRLVARAVATAAAKGGAAPTLIFSEFGCLGARVAAEELGSSLMTLELRPFLYGPLRGLLFSPATLRESWRAPLLGLLGHPEIMLERGIDKFRCELSLPQRRAPLRSWLASGGRCVSAFPKWLDHPPARSRPSHTFAGFIDSGELAGQSMSPGVRAFFDADRSPVVIFADETSGISNEFVRQQIAACRLLHRRAVVVGMPEVGDILGTDGHAYASGHEPPEELVRWAAVVVHGASDTCVIGAAIAGGVPQLIIPCDRDAARVARRLRNFDVARVVRPGANSAPAFARALGDLLGMTAMAERCRQLTGPSRARSDGVAGICRIIEEEHQTLCCPPLHKSPPQPVVMMSSLGKLGRFGNQLFQYGFLKVSARNSGYSAQCPPWPGEKLFGRRDARPPRLLRPAIEQEVDGPTLFAAMPELQSFIESRVGVPAVPIGPEVLTRCPPDVDLFGNFIYHTRHLAPHKEYFRSLFEPLPSIQAQMDEAMTKLRARGRTLVGIHVRRGDFAHLPTSLFTFVVPTAWWAQWLERVWREVEDPVLYIASSEAEDVAASLRQFNPVTARDLGVRLPTAPGCGFFADHYILSRCDVVAISNSSFGFTACMLNRDGRRFERAWPTAPERFLPFDPWDAKPLLFFPGHPYRKTFREIVSVAYETSGLRGLARAILIGAPLDFLGTRAGRMGLAIDAQGLHGAMMSVLSMFMIPHARRETIAFRRGASYPDAQPAR